MKSFLICTYKGPVLVLSRFDSIQQPELLDRLSAYGKFIAHEVPVEAVRDCYSVHFEHLLRDPKESDELIVLDGEGERVYTNVSFQTLGPPAYYEPEKGVRCYPI